MRIEQVVADDDREAEPATPRSGSFTSPASRIMHQPMTQMTPAIS